MSQMSIQAIVLAAGKSTRINTGRSKLAEKICGVPLIAHVTAPLVRLGAAVCVVVGAHKEVVQKIVNAYHVGHNVSFVDQGEPLGTGHALWCTRSQWQADHILVVNGDCPLVTSELLQELVERHAQTNAAMSLVTAHVADHHHAYGRVVSNGGLVKVIEAKEFTLDPREHTLINAGIYLFKRSFLLSGIDQLPRHDKTGEFYLPELSEVAGNQGLMVTLVETNFDLIRGVNTLKELWIAEQICRSRLIEHWMIAGVRFCAAQNVQIDEGVTIGQGTVIGNGVQLLGTTHIGNDCVIDAGTTLENAQIGNNTRVSGNCIVKDSYIAPECLIGPFSYVHSQSVVNAGSRVGSFVEVSGGTVGCRCTINHHAYVEQPAGETPVDQVAAARLDQA